MPDLHGKVVAFLEGRRTTELADLIQRHNGVPLAAPCLREVHRPDAPELQRGVVQLCDADLGVAIFLTGVGTATVFEAARRMGLAKQPKIVISRIEAAPPSKADIVTARAVAPLGQLLAWADGHRLDPAICLFHKGKGWQGELTEAMKDWDIACQPFTSVTDRDAVILRIGHYTTAAFRDRQPEGRRRQDHDGD